MCAPTIVAMKSTCEHESEEASQAKPQGPLSGLRVLEMGQLIAGPFVGKTLAEFGADVVKIEPPAREGRQGGDPLRMWRLLKDGTSVWWQVQSRNKRSIAVDLAMPEGQDIARRLAAEVDVLVENFRPGVLEQWELSPQRLLELNPGLVVLRVSGYGQTGPYSGRPGYGAIGEAMGGLRYLTGEPGRLPVRTGLSIGDTLAALHGVIGVLIALHHRNATRSPTNPRGSGQVIDVALYEAVFNVTESLLPEYSAFNVVREPAGSALPGIAPSNAYACKDGSVLIAGNGDGVFRRLMACIGREDLQHDTSLATNEGRVANVDRLDQAIADWTRQRTVEEALIRLDRDSVPAGRIYTIRDIVADPQYAARDMLKTIKLDDGHTLAVPGIVPKLSATPGGIWRNAPRLGEHTAEVLRELGFSCEQIESMRVKRVIASPGHALQQSHSEDEETTNGRD